MDVVFQLLPKHDSEGDVMATATQSGYRKELDTRKRSSTSRYFENALRRKIVGQEEGVQALVDLYQVFCAGLNSPGRPVGNLLIDRHPGEKGLAFLKDTKQRSCYAPMPFVASKSIHLATVEVRV